MNIYGYSANAKVPFLKIYTTSPSHLNAAKKILETGMAFGRFPVKAYPTFESNMPIVLRFMVDAKMTGMNWIELPASKYKHRSAGEKESSCQYEVDIMYGSGVAPLKLV